MENKPVTVKILERSYNLTIAAEEEKYLLDAATLIDNQARLFKKQYGQRDPQDLLAMVSLAMVTELVKTKNNLKSKDTELIEKLTEIDSVLDNNLHPTRNSL